MQLGEDPSRVYLVGGMGVDGIKKTKLLSKSELEKSIEFRFGARNLLVTYHPVTLERGTSQAQFSTLLGCLDELEDTKIIFTLSNADTDGRIINSMISSYVESHPSTTKAFAAMGRLNYLSTLQFVDAVVGNSSSGLTEAPSLKIGTVNIGDRQKGRLKAESVIDCEPKERAIKTAMAHLYSKEFQGKLRKVRNPYGEGNATERIMEILKTDPIPRELKKEFYDL